MMTPKERAAMQQALEALEDCECSWKQFEAIAACEEALEQPVSQEYQDHLVNQSFDWEAMAAKHQFMEGYRIGLAEMREKCATVCEELDLDWRGLESRIDCAAAIRAIKFEGDTGFRPVSEMIAEHEPAAKHWHDLYRAKCQELHDERARLGAEIVALEQAEHGEKDDA